MIDFIKKSKWVFSGKSSVIFGVVALFTGMIMSVCFAMGQTEIATVSEAPTVLFTPVKFEKSPKPIPTPNLEPVDMHDTAEYGRKKIIELRAKGQLETFTSPNSGAESELKHSLSPVTNFKITPLDCAALLTWDAVPGAKNYRVHISMDGKKWHPVFIPFKGTSVTVGNLENGKTYYFAVAPARILEGTRVIRTAVPVQSSKNVH